jgi:hypothetical protein
MPEPVSPRSTRVGWFIEPLTAIAVIEAAKPVATIGRPLRKCHRADISSEP